MDKAALQRAAGSICPASDWLSIPRRNVLVANYFGSVVSKFSPAGVPAAAAGYPGIGLNQSYGIAIDSFDNVWVTNEQSVTGANNHRLGSVSEFSPAGVELSGNGYTGGGVYYPVAAAADTTGVIWIADYAGSAATLLLASDGSAISGGSGYGASTLPFTSAVAVDSSHNAWFAVQGGVVNVTPPGVTTSYSCCDDPAGIAVDQSGNIWIADYSAPAIVELASNGAVAHQVDLGTKAGPQGIAIDGAGNVWAANYYGNSLAEVAGSNATLLSPVQGLWARCADQRAVWTGHRRERQSLDF